MDEKILYLINHEWTSPALDFFMVLFSSLSVWMPFLILLLIGLLVMDGFRGRAFVACAVFVIAIGDGVVANGLKGLIGRPRPEKIVEGVRMLDFQKAKPRILAIGKPLKIKTSSPSPGTYRGRSFPSGHTLNSFSVATLFALFYRLGWLVYLPASMVAYSRIYTGSHWPSDTLVSTFLGIGISLVIVAIMETLWRRLAPRHMPGTFANHPSLRDKESAA